MIIYYITHSKLYIVVDDEDDTVFKIGRAKRGSKVNPHAVIVDQLDATFDQIHVADGRLFLNWPALIELVIFIKREYPSYTHVGHGNRLFDLFPGSTSICDLMQALARCITSTEHLAHGEDSYFCSKVHTIHTAEFEQLHAEFERKYGHLVIERNSERPQ